MRQRRRKARVCIAHAQAAQCAARASFIVVLIDCITSKACLRLSRAQRRTRDDCLGTAAYPGRRGPVPLAGPALGGQSALTCHIAVLLQVDAQVEALLARQHRLQERRDQLRQSISQEARCPRRDWQAEFAWDAEALDVLASIFGLRHFRCVASRPVAASP